MKAFHSKMKFSLLLITNLITLAIAEPLKPGQPGGPWTEEEIDIVRDKVCHDANIYKPKIKAFVCLDQSLDTMCDRCTFARQTLFYSGWSS